MADALRRSLRGGAAPGETYAPPGNYEGGHGGNLLSVHDLVTRAPDRRFPFTTAPGSGEYTAYVLLPDGLARREVRYAFIGTDRDRVEVVADGPAALTVVFGPASFFPRSATLALLQYTDPAPA